MAGVYSTRFFIGSVLAEGGAIIWPGTSQTVVLRWAELTDGWTSDTQCTLYDETENDILNLVISGSFIGDRFSHWEGRCVVPAGDQIAAYTNQDCGLNICGYLLNP